jgi:hypothetical protein
MQLKMAEAKDAVRPLAVYLAGKIHGPGTNSIVDWPRTNIANLYRQLWP